MFRCAITGRMSRPGDKANKIVTKTRSQVYYGWFRNEETDRWEQREIGHGWEIVEEVIASDEGLRLWNKANKNELQ